MKNLKKILFLIPVLGFFTSCNTSKNPADLLKDEKKKEELFTAVTTDPLLAAGLAEHLSKSPSGIDAFAGNKDLMKLMHSDARFRIMLKSDSTMAETTLGNLANAAVKDSASAAQLGNAILNNDKMRRVIEDMISDRAKEHKEKKHSGSHKKHKHSK